MSLQRRIANLEQLYALPSGGAEEPAELARRREELKAKIARVSEKAAREEAEGNPTRRIALEELEEALKRKMDLRQRREDRF